MTDIIRESSAIAEAESRAHQARTRPVGALTFLALLIAIFAVPAAIRPSASGKLPFDEDRLAEFAATSPDYVFIGNSMLGSRIDESVLRKTFGDGCCYVMWAAGTESAWAHQALKNIVLAVDHRPKTIFIFFRDTVLTRPTRRATDRYWWRIERLSHDDEPELKKAMAASRTWQERLEYDLGLLYPVQKRRESTSYLLEWTASQVAAPGKTPFGKPAASQYNELFGLDKLRNIAIADDAEFTEQESPAVYDFDKSVSNSLLPSMINLARNAGVDLVFVRVQRRPSEEGPPYQSQELQQYVAKLQSYITTNGAHFYDFTGDPELTLDRYLDGDHIRPDWRASSTRLFVRRLQPYFQ